MIIVRFLIVETHKIKVKAPLKYYKFRKQIPTRTSKTNEIP